MMKKKYVFEKFERFMISLQNLIPNFVVIPTIQKILIKADADIKGNSNDWANEIHPNPGGCIKFAKAHIQPIINTLYKVKDSKRFRKIINGETKKTANKSILKIF